MKIVIMTISSGLQLSRFTRLLRILLSFVSFSKEEFLEFRRLEHFIHGVLTICLEILVKVFRQMVPIFCFAPKIGVGLS